MIREMHPADQAKSAGRPVEYPAAGAAFGEAMCDSKQVSGLPESAGPLVHAVQ